MGTFRHGNVCSGCDEGRHGVLSTASACHVSGCHACWLRVME
ncbi:hypothetical protein LHK_00767 [Laribacter hongkongensis HLHK9]|uniref:Uncharacterized protein n=1 Tax=Laribacter hongkongensis (strain HLHK9) TaxID=557598 RepID=C1D4G6_LARHH|nr:hypothetical protein LHK_00767 [Laribacter hongkongensis HLHK9]